MLLKGCLRGSAIGLHPPKIISPQHFNFSMQLDAVHQHIILLQPLLPNTTIMTIAFGKYVLCIRVFAIASAQ